MEKLVSVVIPTYRRVGQLGRAIESVLNQKYKHVEVIVVDDNNPDTEYRVETEEYMERYKDNNKVKYIKNEHNMGGNVTRNRGLYAAEGEYVGFLDDDDYYYSNKIANQVDFLEKNEEYAYVSCGISIGEKKYAPSASGDVSFELLSGSQIFLTTTLLFRKKVLLEVDGWDLRLNRHQEAALQLKVLARGYKMYSMSDVLCFMDISDRANIEDAEKNETTTYKFLDCYKDIIEKFPVRKQRDLYCRRHFSIILTYFKEKKFKRGMQLLLQKTVQHPIAMTIVGVRYCRNRYLTKNKTYPSLR